MDEGINFWFCSSFAHVLFLIWVILLKEQSSVFHVWLRWQYTCFHRRWGRNRWIWCSWWCSQFWFWCWSQSRSWASSCPSSLFRRGERARQEDAAKRATEEASRIEKGEEPSSSAEYATMTECVNITLPKENKETVEEMVSVFISTSAFGICVSVWTKKSYRCMVGITFNFHLNTCMFYGLVCLDVIICDHQVIQR